MPVHLGSMGESVQTIIARRGGAIAAAAMSYVLNAPYNGGTHLPDVTVVMPVFVRTHAAADGAFRRGARPSRGYRRHHAGLDAT